MESIPIPFLVFTALYFTLTVKTKFTVKFKIGRPRGYLYNFLLHDQIFHVCKNKFLLTIFLLTN